jgi:hypothetical protein
MRKSKEMNIGVSKSYTSPVSSDLSILGPGLPDSISFHSDRLNLEFCGWVLECCLDALPNHTEDRDIGPPAVVISLPANQMLCKIQWASSSSTA